jgi:hypothetical protein
MADAHKELCKLYKTFPVLASGIKNSQDIQLSLHVSNDKPLPNEIFSTTQAGDALQGWAIQHKAAPTWHRLCQVGAAFKKRMNGKKPVVP